jgi:hypothetical protein
VGVRVNQELSRGIRGIVGLLVKRYFALVGRLLTGGKAPADVNTGLFAVNRKAMTLLNERLLERFPEPQIFISACRAGLRVQELPVTQFERSHGSSSIDVVGGLRMFYRFNAFVLNELARRRKC